MPEKQILEISALTFLKLAAIVLGLIFVYLIRDILVMIFLAVIIAAAADTPIDWLARHKIRRGLAVAIVYIFALAIFGLIIYLIVPSLANQVKQLAINLPDYLKGLENKLQGAQATFGVENLQDLLAKTGDRLSNMAGNVFAAVVSVFGGLFSMVIILVISIYLAAKEQGIKNFFLSFTSLAHQQYVASLVDRILFKLGAWLRGQVLLMVAIGVLVFIGLSLLKVKYALTLALLAGLLEIVPIIGPIAAAVPAVIFAFFQSPGLALAVAGLYYLIQELEKYLLVPMVMKRTVGLSPIPIIVAVLIGGKLYGVLGIVVAIPLAAVISVVVHDLVARKTFQA